MSKYQEIMSKMITEPVFLLNSFEDIAMRTEIVDGEIKYFMKPRGLYEYSIAYNSKLVAETEFEANEITKEQYDAY